MEAFGINSSSIYGEVSQANRFVLAVLLLGSVIWWVVCACFKRF